LLKYIRGQKERGRGLVSTRIKERESTVNRGKGVNLRNLTKQSDRSREEKKGEYISLYAASFQKQKKRKAVGGTEEAGEQEGVVSHRDAEEKKRANILWLFHTI